MHHKSAVPSALAGAKDKIANDNMQGPLQPQACPQCGTDMRLARIEPRADEAGGDEVTYDCACGATFSRVFETRR